MDKFYIRGKPMNDKFKRIAWFIVMSILWSVVFVTALHSWAGIGIGVCCGISMTGIGSSISKKKEDKHKKSDEDENEE